MPQGGIIFSIVENAKDNIVSMCCYSGVTFFLSGMLKYFR